MTDQEPRQLIWTYHTYWSNLTADNTTGSTDFDSNLVKAEDVSVRTVVTSLYFNGFAFLFLMVSYELLRRLYPAVYSSRKRQNMAGERSSQADVLKASSSLPDDQRLDWVGPVFGVPWSKVLENAGLDGYFFLRYIRMNVRITAISTFWFFIILVPVYGTGGSYAPGWYHLSAANLPANSPKMFLPCVMMYAFTGFIFFVIQQEYRHFREIRQQFLARGVAHVHPQHHYSITVENIPPLLRSDRALADYFDKLFPGAVHSASVVLKLPDVEEASRRCMRSCRRLEKSIAFLHCTKHRPMHIVGRGRISVLGIDLAPLECTQPWNGSQDEYDEDAVYEEMSDFGGPRPAKGTRVDSISYYTQELAAHSRKLFKLQKKMATVAATGNVDIKAENWLDRVVTEASVVAARIMRDSVQDNSLTSPQEVYAGIAEVMGSQYGSFETPPNAANSPVHKSPDLLRDDISYATSATIAQEANYGAPFSRDQYRTRLRRIAGRLGLDFAVYVGRMLNKQIDVALEGVVSNNMSSTGFVTFLDLASTTCASSAPLTVKANVLNVSVAPEPREIIWENALVSRRTQNRRERLVNIVLFLVAILWSFPLAAIQAFAKAEFLATIPGLEWILTMHGGALTNLVNGYLPVVALLTLILILPVIFEIIALKYERRKTLSDVQASMLGRYFYFQLANIYVSVTAGSILKSLADILDRPTNILELLGESLPTMVGYFVALLVTKILAGLPMTFLRFGALGRMMFLKILSNRKKLTQRELDAVYKLENIQYGWEFPSQLLVVMIVFTYAVICPVILPFGLVYFLGALTVYKKQILYVYSPVYESGGSMFPIAVQRTILGLICAQLTFLGYTVTRGCYYQPVFLFPLPMISMYVMNHFQKSYAEPSKQLSLERARECDRLSSLDLRKRASEEVNDAIPVTSDPGVEMRRHLFDKRSYRQPVLSEAAAEPWMYRRSRPDDVETIEVRKQLRNVNRFQFFQSESEQRHLNTTE